MKKNNKEKQFHTYRLILCGTRNLIRLSLIRNTSLVKCEIVNAFKNNFILPIQLAQFDSDISSGQFKTFVMILLEKLGEYHQFQRAWDIDVSIEREQLPEGAVEEEDDSEYEDATSGLIQTDSAPVSHGHLVTDSGVMSYGSQGSQEGQPELGEFLSY